MHVSLALRLIGGDLAGNTPLWRAGGIGGEIAILLFFGASTAAVVGARRAQRQALRERAEASRMREAFVRG